MLFDVILSDRTAPNLSCPNTRLLFTLEVTVLCMFLACFSFLLFVPFSRSVLLHPLATQGICWMISPSIL